MLNDINLGRFVVCPEHRTDSSLQLARITRKWYDMGPNETDTCYKNGVYPSLGVAWHSRTSNIDPNPLGSKLHNQGI
jgi:hypothetical protein